MTRLTEEEIAEIERGWHDPMRWTPNQTRLLRALREAYAEIDRLEKVINDARVRMEGL